MTEVALNDVLVIQRCIVRQGCGHFFRIVEIRGLHQQRNTPVKAFHHAVGLGMLGRNQTVFNVQSSAGFVKRMVASRFAFAIDREAVSELFAVIR